MSHVPGLPLSGAGLHKMSLLSPFFFCHNFVPLSLVRLHLLTPALLASFLKNFVRMDDFYVHVRFRTNVASSPIFHRIASQGLPFVPIPGTIPFQCRHVICFLYDFVPKGSLCACLLPARCRTKEVAELK